jgi:outer membrane protein OmpA-like peptidoglycan-associated protein
MRGAMLALAAALGVVATPVAAMTGVEADDPIVVAAAEAAVARVGAARARALVPTVRNVPALVAAVGASARGIKTTVVELESAKRNLAAEENDLELRVALPADVLFDFDKATIRADAAKALAYLATIIRSYTGAVRLIGHTDSDGSDAYNLDLSKRRAAAVRQWLVDRETIAATHLATEGRGEAEPIAPNDTAENKQLNRRVDVVIRKR